MFYMDIEMNVISAMITVTLVAVIVLGNIISANSVLAKSDEANDTNGKVKSQSNVIELKSQSNGSQIKSQSNVIQVKSQSDASQKIEVVKDPFGAIIVLSAPLKDSFTQSISTQNASAQNASAQSVQTSNTPLQIQQLNNPLLDKEEFDITVTNIKQHDILVALTVDGLKNSTVIPGSPILPNPTPTKVVVFKFNRHEGSDTPGVLPIKLGDQYTACISFTTNTEKATCLAAGIDSITQAQKKTLDSNYIPT